MKDHQASPALFRSSNTVLKAVMGKAISTLRTRSLVLLLGGLLLIPQFASAGDVVSMTLNVEAAITQALANNPDFAAQDAWTQAARERATAVAARRWPELGFRGDYQAYSEDMRLLGARANGEPGVFASDFIEGGVTVRLPLYTGGRLTSEIRGLNVLAQSADARLLRNREELIFSVCSLFYTILAQRHVIESVEFSAKAMDEHFRRVNELVTEQKAANVDALRTDVRRAELQQRLIETRNTLAVQVRTLANLLGMEEGSLPPLEGQLERDPPFTCPIVTECVVLALENRSDFRAARLETDAAELTRRAARGERLPSVSLTGSYGYRQAVNPSEQPDGTDRAEAIGRVGIVVEVPIFEGGRLRAKVREAEANLEAARQRERSVRLRIRREVETAWMNVEAARQHVEVARVAARQAEESLRIEREKYDLGKGTILDVLDAQSVLLQVQTSIYRALADLNTAIAGRDLAVGKEWR